MWILSRSLHGVVAATRQIHMDYQVLWRKKDETATLSRGEHADSCLDRLLLGLICIGIQGVYVKLINHCHAE